MNKSISLILLSLLITLTAEIINAERIHYYNLPTQSQLSYFVSGKQVEVPFCFSTLRGSKNANTFTANNINSNSNSNINSINGINGGGDRYYLKLKGPYNPHHSALTNSVWSYLRQRSTFTINQVDITSLSSHPLAFHQQQSSSNNYDLNENDNLNDGAYQSYGGKSKSGSHKFSGLFKKSWSGEYRCWMARFTLPASLKSSDNYQLTLVRSRKSHISPSSSRRTNSISTTSSSDNNKSSSVASNTSVNNNGSERKWSLRSLFGIPGRKQYNWSPRFTILSRKDVEPQVLASLDHLDDYHDPSISIVSTIGNGGNGGGVSAVSSVADFKTRTD